MNNTMNNVFNRFNYNYNKMLEYPTPIYLQNTSTKTENVKEEENSAYKRSIVEKYKGVIQVFENNQQLQDTQKPIIIVFHHFRDFVDKLTGWCDPIYQLAQEFPETIVFGIADYDMLMPKGSHALGENFENFTTKMLEYPPRVHAYDIEKYQFYLTDPYELDYLRHFCKKLLLDQLRVSQHIPNKEDCPSRVKVVVWLNFEETLRTDKDIFIAFYDMRTMLSHDLLPLLDELVEKLAQEDILIVKMDSESNFVPRKFRGNVFLYPLCYFLRKSDKNNAIKYPSSCYTVDQLIRFIGREATEPLKGYDRKGKVKDSSPENIPEYEPLNGQEDALKSGLNVGRNNRLEEGLNDGAKHRL